MEVIKCKCGEDAEVEFVYSSEGSYYRVYCPKGCFDVKADTEEEAISSWNKSLS